MIREIVKIDESLCDGCGNCVPGCHEGALQIIDGKARLISDLMCDGLGACLGHCPQGAITLEKREAEPYDEVKVMKIMVGKGKNTVAAHMKHLKDHKEYELLKQAVDYLKENQEGLDFEWKEVLMLVRDEQPSGPVHGGGCPGSASRSFNQGSQRAVPLLGSLTQEEFTPSVSVSELTHWPVQLHLANPEAGHYKGSDLVLSADCVAYSTGGFHQKYLKGKTLAIACPKLDQGKEIYVEKLRSMIDDARINTLHLLIMQVPCCGGLRQIVEMALEKSSRKVPVKETIIGVQGDVLKEEWI